MKNDQHKADVMNLLLSPGLNKISCLLCREK